MKNIDNTQLTIIKELKFAILEKFNVNISIEEITDVVESQYKIVQMGAIKSEAVKLPYFGTFIPKKELYKKIEELAKKEKIITNNLFEELGKLDRIKRILIKKNLRKKALEEMQKTIDTKDFLNKPTPDVPSYITFPILRHLNFKHKLIE